MNPFLFFQNHLLGPLFLGPLLCFTVFLFAGGKADPEPWLSNRYGQNCAACHAPGRWNVEPKKRRCTLSCQGCHVNPNGGGLRDSYGKWNQQRWLKSFHIEGSSVSRLRPSKNQDYIEKDHIEKKTPEDQKKGQKKPSKKRVTLKHSPLYPSISLNLDSSLDHPTQSFNKYFDLAWQTNVDKPTFMSRIPREDPWSKEREQIVFAGADLRYLFGHIQRRVKDLETDETTKRQVYLQGLMNVDVGIQFKPIKENLSFVIENRFSNGPSKGSHHLERGFTSKSRVRSAYLISDDLSYNSWVMAGLYRPMFGYYNPDHESLSNRITGMNQNTVFKSIGVGTAPNVPFFNAHWIIPTEGNNFSQNKGINLNMGGRFVTYSLNFKGSYWNTQSKTGDEKSKKTLYALTAGGLFKDLTVNVELIRFIERLPLSLNRGNVYTLDTKYRFWRENYAVFNMARANTAISKGPGHSSEVGVGYKGYLLSGLKFECLYLIRKNQEDSLNQHTLDRIVQGQIHYFF